MAMRLRLRGSSRTNYAYAVARVQARRAKLIPARDYEKILHMDLSEITRFIEDSAYKTEVDELASRFSGLDLLEAALTVNEERAYSAVRKMLVGEGGALVDLFLERYVIEDIKTVLRGKQAGASREELLKELLLEDLDTYNIFQPLLADDVRTPDDVVLALERQGGKALDLAQSMRKVPEGSDLSRYEDALDKAYYSRLQRALEGSKQTGAAQFLKFTQLEVDARNLLNAARWVASGQKGDFSPYIIPGGKEFSVAQLMALASSEDLTGFADGLGDHPHAETLRAGLKQAQESRRLAPFQATVWRTMIGGMGTLAHGYPLSIVPILLYLIQKHKEVVTLRAVARGKAAGLTEERLRELIA